MLDKNKFIMHLTLTIIAFCILNGIPNAHAMTYRDNSVSFSLSNTGYSLVSGSYTVNSFSVTDKQDPKKKIHSGLTKTLNNKGSMTFSVGRKGSKDTAKWFNTKIPAPQTTFNHTAGKLNFAFLGTLKLELTGGLLGSGKESFTFSNITLAQGHSGASNNWWFGGQNCANISINNVICTGVSSKGSNVTFVFLRGGNSANTVAIIPLNIVDTLSWMEKLKDAVTLDKLIMPGSHDAGMSETNHCDVISSMGTGYVKTQSLSVGGQLVNGSRYFDIRVDYDHNNLVTYHRNGSMGCNGQDLKDVLDETVAFLNSHTTETAILKISHIRSNRGNQAKIKKKINELLTNNYKNNMYINTNKNINLASIPLGKVRGKMIFVFDYSDYIDPTTGKFRYKDGYSNNSCTTQANANLTVCDSYSDTATYNDMKKDQLNKWKNCAAFGAGHLFLLSWTLTASKPVIQPTIQELAKVANTNLPSVLYDQIKTKGTAKPNIVYIDYINNATTQSIIQYNF